MRQKRRLVKTQNVQRRQKIMTDADACNICIQKHKHIHTCESQEREGALGSREAKC